MILFNQNNDSKQRLIDSIYFWCFWIIITGLLIILLKQTPISAVKTIIALIIPQIIPVYIISSLFDSMFVRRKLLLFFIISIPFCFGFGFLINIWFQWIMNNENIQANNEVVIFIFSSMFIGFRYIRVALSQRILLKEEENKRVVAELQYLRSQLNPHFLFNALNSIYSLILSKSDKASEATLALSELMRFHIDLSGKQFIDLLDEISMIERYIALEKLKLEKRCDIQLNIKGDSSNIKIAPLIFMPFVENAFKHGISSAPESNYVYVNIVANERQIEFKISNSIPRLTISKRPSETKLGIDNTIKRLELHYKDNYEFFSFQEDNVYTVIIKINIKKNAA